MYSRSLHHSGDFELSGRCPFFCATKHLSSRFDAILKLDLVWGFIKGFVLFILLSARKNSVQGASSSSQQEWSPMSLTLLLIERLVYLLFSAYTLMHFKSYIWQVLLCSSSRNSI